MNDKEQKEALKEQKQNIKYERLKEKKFEELKYLIAVEGYLDKDIIKYLKIAKSTYYKWLNEKSDFSDLVRGARNRLVPDIVDSLYKIAKGYDYKNTTTTTEVLLSPDGKKVLKKKVKQITKHVVVPPHLESIKMALNKLEPKWRPSVYEQQDEIDIDHNQVIADNNLAALLEEDIPLFDDSIPGEDDEE